MSQVRRLCGWLAILSIVLMATSCRHNPSHPNQIDAFDGHAYDVLSTEAQAIEQAKQELATHTLPASAKEYLNIAIKQYGVARSLWLDYRRGVPGATQPVVQQALDRLAQDISNLRNATGGK